MVSDRNPVKGNVENQVTKAQGPQLSTPCRLVLLPAVIPSACFQEPCDQREKRASQSSKKKDPGQSR